MAEWKAASDDMHPAWSSDSVVASALLLGVTLPVTLRHAATECCDFSLDTRLELANFLRTVNLLARSPLLVLEASLCPHYSFSGIEASLVRCTLSVHRWSGERSLETGVPGHMQVEISAGKLREFHASHWLLGLVTTMANVASRAEQLGIRRRSRTAACGYKRPQLDFKLGVATRNATPPSAAVCVRKKRIHSQLRS
eukprot:3478002-Amphidinium_carterae.1